MAKQKTPAPIARPSQKHPREAEEVDRIGSVLGSYRVLELMGKGGMGYVYRAEHVKLGREVALKLLRSDYARRRDAVARFIQEARTVNRIRHRNIVDVPDIVELDDGTTFIVMEFLRGQSLGAWSRTGVDLPRALAVLVQICDGLSAAHDVGIVHRDLKPDNVMVVPTSDGAELVKLLDFGVAKLLNRDDEDIGFQTQAGSVIGTPAYMSPEQAGGMVVDARSDAYSLGAIMYELFCGQPMFKGRSFGEYVRKHLTEMPVRPRDTPLGAQIDPRLEAVILKCLEKDPNQRYEQIVELRDTLLFLLGGLDANPGMSTPVSTPSLRPGTVPSIVAPAPTPSAPRGQMYSPSGPPSDVALAAATPGGSDPARSAPGFDAGRPSLAAADLAPRASATFPAGYAQPAGYPQSNPFVMPTGREHAMVGQEYGLHPSQHIPPPTPWWVWVSGGAIAVAIGIGGAVWYAGRSDEPDPATTAAKPPNPLVDQPAQPDPAPPTQPGPAVDPPADPAPPPEPTKFEVRFESIPMGAGVYAEGATIGLCVTPCTVSVDLNDGGAKDRRTFVLRVAGFRDKTVVVDLGGSQHQFLASFNQPIAPPPAPPPPDKPKDEPKPVKKPPDKRPVRPTRPVETAPKKNPDALIDPERGVRGSTRPGKTTPPTRIDPSERRDPFKSD
ncbi:MAG: protein kinase [Kofleriaceae bacterium]